MSEISLINLILFDHMTALKKKTLEWSEKINGKAMSVDIDLNAIDYELPSCLLHGALVYGCYRSTLYFNFIPSPVI